MDCMNTANNDEFRSQKKNFYLMNNVQSSVFNNFSNKSKKNVKKVTVKDKDSGDLDEFVYDRNFLNGNGYNDPCKGGKVRTKESTSKKPKRNSEANTERPSYKEDQERNIYCRGYNKKKNKKEINQRHIMTSIGSPDEHENFQLTMNEEDYDFSNNGVTGIGGIDSGHL